MMVSFIDLISIPHDTAGWTLLPYFRLQQISPMGKPENSIKAGCAGSA
jgi:hypothetical protein